jgi:hypothetical protein
MAAKLEGWLEERKDPSLRIHLGIILGGAPLPAESPESVTIDVPCEVEAIQDSVEVPREE